MSMLHSGPGLHVDTLDRDDPVLYRSASRNMHVGVARGNEPRIAPGYPA